MRFFRRQEVPWEVVASRAIDTTPTYCDEELEDDLDVVSVSEANASRKYVFDIKSMSNTSAVPNAVVFARQQLLQQVSKYGYNIFIQESWDVTVYRRGKVHRIEVYYTGRPAQAVGVKIPSSRPPPFITMLKDCAQ